MLYSGISSKGNTPFNIVGRLCCLFAGLAVLSVSMVPTGCARQSLRGELRQVDSLIMDNRVNAAAEILASLDKSELEKPDAVYYDLLKTKVLYLNYAKFYSDSLIDGCVRFYEMEHDLRNLGEAYYYKGVVNKVLGNRDSAIWSLKKAESLALQSSDNALKHKIYTELVWVNYVSANYALALQFARKELECSLIEGNKLWVAHSYNHLSCVHNILGNKDSVFFYIAKTMPYVQLMTDKEKACHLSNIGLYYIHYGNSAKGKEYLWNAYRIAVIADNANLLARVLYDEGKRDEAMAIWNNTLANSDLEGRVKITAELADVYHKEQNYKLASNLTRKLKIMKDSLEQSRYTSQVHQLQLEYDYNESLQDKNDIFRTIIFAIAALVALVAVISWYYVYRAKKAGKSNKKIIDSYKNRIDELEILERDASEKVTMLEEKVASATVADSATLNRGHKLYECIMKGDTVIRWSKEDFGSFVEYCKVLNPELHSEMDSRYLNLSPVNKMLLILQDIGFDSNSIRHAMCMTPGALRAARFRIKNKENSIS